ncbi:MAG: hypothetical protein ACTSQ8_13000, partial [Candidatus Helarchaeota archaeon]
VIAVDPRDTSKYCAKLEQGELCGKRLKGVKGDYDLQRCSVHKIVPRHINSALEIARRGFIKRERGLMV